MHKLPGTKPILAGSASLTAVSNAPCNAEPVFCTTMAKRTISLASALRRLLSMGVVIKSLERSVPVKRLVQVPVPAAENVTGASAVCVNVALGLLLLTMPLLSRSKGAASRNVVTALRLLV